MQVSMFGLTKLSAHFVTGAALTQSVVAAAAVPTAINGVLNTGGCAAVLQTTMCLLQLGVCFTA
jgi:hypothetical protein